LLIPPYITEKEIQSFIKSVSSPTRWFAFDRAFASWICFRRENLGNIPL
jgi:hypothetical protein